jgi:DNA invertase Pin-like site-specific DNA recombinase
MMTPMKGPTPPSTAYSYVRFSTPEQRNGDSLRRQTEAAQAWCDRNNARLDTSTTLHDLGTSAFRGSHRQNPDRNALAAFLKLVEDGKVERGSLLLIESLDRLTREHIRPALTLLLNLIDKGVRVVQLKPVELVYDEDVEPMQLMMALMELSRGNSESRMKSSRVGAAWKEKRDRARRGDCQVATKTMGENCQFLTRRVPGWIEVRGGKLHSIPRHVATIKQIFAWSAQGLGDKQITRKLIADQVPAFLTTVRRKDRNGVVTEKPGTWNRVYVKILLTDRRVLGELQLYDSDGDPDGEPIKGYFPRVIKQAQWDAARRGTGKRPRSVKHCDLFPGLLFEALSGGTMMATTRMDKDKVSRVLVNVASEQARAPCISFPLPTFERAILTCLAEVDPESVLAEAKEVDDRAVLEGEIIAIDAELAEAGAFMAQEGFSVAIGNRVRDLETKKGEKLALLAEAQTRAALPLDRSWANTTSLLEVLDTAPDQTEVRIRLRAELRRIIDSIHLVIVPRRRDRLCAVSMHFSGGGRRDYIILHRPSRSNGKATVPGHWRVSSWRAEPYKEIGLPQPDIASIEDAAEMASTLAIVPPDVLELMFRGCVENPIP